MREYQSCEKAAFFLTFTLSLGSTCSALFWSKQKLSFRGYNWRRDRRGGFLRRALQDIQCGQHIARFPLCKEAQKGDVMILKTELGTQVHIYQLLVGLNAFFIPLESFFPELKFLLRYSQEVHREVSSEKLLAWEKCSLLEPKPPSWIFSYRVHCVFVVNSEPWLSP